MSNFIQLSFSDGAINQLQVFASDQAKAQILMMPAMGVRASFYDDFCAQLSAKGYHVYSLDLRGHGKSSVRASRKSDYGYAELIMETEIALNVIRERHPELKIFTLGHSLGGQVAMLLASQKPQLINGLIKVASCMVYHDGWKGNGGWKIKLAGWLFPYLAKVVGHFPGDKLGFGGRDATKLISEWSENALFGGYDFDEQIDYDADMAKASTSILSITLEGDWMAPQRAAKNLIEKFSEETAVTRAHLKPGPDQKPYNHFNWAKRSNAVIEQIENWIESVAESGQ